MLSNSDSLNRPFKGFILAAGFGTRLLPMTRKIPKAMVPFMNGVLADCALDLMQTAAAHPIGINAHHHLDQVAKFAVDREIRLFREREILGTGGYLKNLGRFFDRHLLVVNCDAIFLNARQTVQELVETHIRSGMIATLVLLERGDRTVTGISAGSGRVIEIGEGPFMFTGMYMVSPEIVSLVDVPDIVPAFRHLALSGELGAVVHPAPWFDAGTRQGLIAAHQQVSGRKTVVYDGAQVDTSAELENAVIYPGCRVGPEARVTDSILMKTTVYPGEQIEGEIRA